LKIKTQFYGPTTSFSLAETTVSLAEKIINL